MKFKVGQLVIEINVETLNGLEVEVKLSAPIEKSIHDLVVNVSYVERSAQPFTVETRVVKSFDGT